MSIRVIGLDELQEALAKIKANLDNVEIVTKSLAEGMRQYVHVDSGDLQASIDFQGAIAYAETDYAGLEADRGDSHDYATLAIEAWDVEAWADEVVKDY